MSIKRYLLPVVRVGVCWTQPLKRMKRLWAHATLQNAVQYPVSDSVVVLGTPEIQGTGNVRLGGSLFLYRDLYLETQGEGRIEIGDRVVISRGSHIVSFHSIQIGADSMIGEYTSIRDANHTRVEGVPSRQTNHQAKPIVIGSNVWVGRGVTIVGGVRIGDNAIIGANSVVTHDVPAGSTVAGAPARPLALRRAA